MAPFTVTFLHVAAICIVTCISVAILFKSGT